MKQQQKPPLDEKQYLEAMKEIWGETVLLQMNILPRDAWILVGFLQMAWRHTDLSDEMKKTVETFGRQIQEAICALSSNPVLHEAIEMGWHTEFDVIKETPDDGPTVYKFIMGYNDQKQIFTFTPFEEEAELPPDCVYDNWGEIDDNIRCVVYAPPSIPTIGRSIAWQLFLEDWAEENLD